MLLIPFYLHHDLQDEPTMIVLDYMDEGDLYTFLQESAPTVESVGSNLFAVEMLRIIRLSPIPLFYPLFCFSFPVFFS